MIFAIQAQTHVTGSLMYSVAGSKVVLKQVSGEVKNKVVKHNIISTPRTSYEAIETILLYFFSHFLLLH